MAKLGTRRNPAVVRVQSQDRAVVLLKLCDERNWTLIAGIEPDKPEDVSDVERLVGTRLDLSGIPGGEERLCLFYHACPDIAAPETRSALVLHEGQWGLPAGIYSFLENYCVHPLCDCRYALIWVVTEQEPELVATIRHRFGAGGPERTFLDPQAPQTLLAAGALRLFREAVCDPAYEARLERHYRMFKESVADPAHPINARLRAEGLRAGEPIVQERRPMSPDGTLDLGLRKPCPCGSGRKYKRCCWDRRARRQGPIGNPRA